MKRRQYVLLTVSLCSSTVAGLLIGYLVWWSDPALGYSATPTPLGLPSLETHQLPVAKQVDLGRKLFFDRQLAFNNTNSCAMCHIESQGLTSHQSATAIGMEGRSLSRNAPALYNVAYQRRLFHDGRESDLSQQAWGPLLSPFEMGNPSIGHIVDKVRSLDDYRGLFEASFDGQGASMQTIGDALASYQRTILSGNSRFDQWFYGKDAAALTVNEKAGFEVFMGKGQCATCHTVGEKSALFTDQKFHVTGIGYRNAVGSGSGVSRIEIAPGEFVEMKHEDMTSFSAPRINDVGRFAITLKAEDRWAYKTPSLRNIELTFPYMHDGSLSTLEDVVNFYDKGGLEHDGTRVIEPLGLTALEKSNLVAFLMSLTSPDDKAKQAMSR